MTCRPLKMGGTHRVNRCTGGMCYPGEGRVRRLETHLTPIANSRASSGYIVCTSAW